MVAQPITANLLQCHLNPRDVFHFTEIRQLVWSSNRCLPNMKSQGKHWRMQWKLVSPMGTDACWLLHEHTRPRSLSQPIIIIFHNRIITIGGVSCYMVHCTRPKVQSRSHAICSVSLNKRYAHTLSTQRIRKTSALFILCHDFSRSSSIAMEKQGEKKNGEGKSGAFRLWRPLLFNNKQLIHAVPCLLCESLSAVIAI